MKGQHITNKKHYPNHKIITPEQIKSTYREQMANIGPHALEFFEKFTAKNSNKYGYRSITGILALRKKYDDKTIDAACHRAYTYGALQYKTVKSICEKGLDNLPLQTETSYINPKQTLLSRNLTQYNKLLTIGERRVE